MNTLINYHYQDESNFKSFSEDIILPGSLTKIEVKTLMDKFNDSEGFVPSQIGLLDLQGELISQFGDSDADHLFHFLDEVTVTNKNPTTAITAQEFFKKMTTMEWELW